MNQTMTNAAARLDHRAASATPGPIERLRRYLATRRALREVQSLDDRMLRDIGLDAAQIESAVRGKY